MSSFNYDKKKEHEQLAKKALEEHNDKLAFHHTCQAAMHTFLLAKSCDGQVAQNYLANARGLLEVAKQLKERMQKDLRDLVLNYWRIEMGLIFLQVMNLMV